MMYDDVGTKKEVLHCHTDEAHTKVSFMLPQDDNNKSQIVKMRQIPLNVGNQVQLGFIGVNDVFHTLNSTVM